MGRYSIGVDIDRSKVPAQAELKCHRCDALVPAEKLLIQTKQVHGLGRFVLSTVKENFFRAEKIICGECGNLLEVNIKKA